MERTVKSEGGGFESMLDKKIQLWCQVYIYAGTLSSVNEDYLELSDGVVVYETGGLQDPEWKDAQEVMGPLRVMRQAIESWSEGR